MCKRYVQYVVSFRDHQLNLKGEGVGAVVFVGVKKQTFSLRGANFFRAKLSRHYFFLQKQLFY